MAKIPAGQDACPASLSSRKCIPCEGGAAPLKGEALAGLLAQVPLWQVIGEHHLTRTFKFPNFAKALAFVNRAGALAEEQGHHPLIHFTWGKVTVDIWTHKIDGLTESDFILAAKIDLIPTD